MTLERRQSRKGSAINCGVLADAKVDRTDNKWYAPLMAGIGAKTSASLNHLMLTANRAVVRKFWQKVDRGSSCWLWQGSVNWSGYGTFQLDGKTVMAHRFALAQSTKKATNLHALHSCHVPGCVRPSHLRWGTPKDNGADASAAKRHKPHRGAKHYASVLKTEQIGKIWRKYKKGASAAVLARDYGVSHGAILSIVRGKTWRHVTAELGPPTPAKSLLTKSQVLQIWKSYARHKTCAAVEAETGVKRHVVYQVMKKNAYAQFTAKLPSVQMNKKYAGRISSEDAVKIEHQLIAGETIADIARRFDVSFNAIAKRAKKVQTSLAV